MIVLYSDIIWLVTRELWRQDHLDNGSDKQLSENLPACVGIGRPIRPKCFSPGCCQPPARVLKLWFSTTWVLLFLLCLLCGCFFPVFPPCLLCHSFPSFSSIPRIFTFEPMCFASAFLFLQSTLFLCFILQPEVCFCKKKKIVESNHRIYVIGLLALRESDYDR